MTTVAIQTERELQARLGAQMFLAETGWRMRIERGHHQGREVAVFFAVHDKWPEQRAITVSELAKRCAWQEAHRTPLSENRDPDA